MTDALVRSLIEAAHAAILAHVDELTELDQAIGDGDHGVNMRRGVESLYRAREEIAALPFGEAMRRAGTTMVMQVGGASGPLYGSFLLAVGEAFAAAPKDRDEIARLARIGLQAVTSRGKSDVGAKTLIDVLAPVTEAISAGDPGGAADRVRAAVEDGLASTRDLRALTGRASYLGERSIGHLDPGARSAAALTLAICDVIEGKSPLEDQVKTVSIVIVSQSPDVAKGAAEMVRKMVGGQVRVAACGGDVEGDIGTDVGAIMRAIEQVYTPRGVAVLVDLGGAESSTEMAIEMLPKSMAPHIRICDAPIVEGAVMAATESAGGAPLERVCETAEEFRS